MVLILFLFFPSVLQTKADVPGVESTLVACLERIFSTKHGASLIPHYMVCKIFVVQMIVFLFAM